MWPSNASAFADAIYDSQAIRASDGVDLNRESAPDATTLLKFRHLLESKELTRQIFDTINGHLAEKGLMMRDGTIVDARLIAAPSSTKNKDGKRDPEMHQSKEGILDIVPLAISVAAGASIAPASGNGVMPIITPSCRPAAARPAVQASLPCKSTEMHLLQFGGGRRGIQEPSPMQAGDSAG